MATTDEIKLGDVLDELGIQLPAVDELTAPESNPEEPIEAEAAEVENPESEESPAPEAAESEDSDDTTEEKTEGEEESNSSDPGEEEPEDKADRSLAKMNKRVDKLTARAKSAEEQSAALQAELASAKEALAKAQPIIVQDTADPLADITTPADLDAKIASANTVLDAVPDLIAKAEMEGGEVEVPMGNGATQKFTSAQLRDRLQVAKSIVRGESAKRSYFAQRETYIAEAKTAYPEIFQEGSQLRQTMQATLRQLPALARLPNLELIIGDALRGQAARFAEAETLVKAKAKAATPPPKPAAKAVAAPKVVAPSAAPRAKSTPDPMSALKETGTRQAAETFVASIFN